MISLLLLIDGVLGKLGYALIIDLKRIFWSLVFVYSCHQILQINLRIRCLNFHKTNYGFIPLTKIILPPGAVSIEFSSPVIFQSL